ncbi:PKD domain-containing protein [Daejeonella sp.]|uniref:PKD domain-containing protein n=1 Tax=Daejeonella sp. TaxID=2805397 RepID=UPI0030BD4058
MKKVILLVFILSAWFGGFAQAPLNDKCINAVLINDATSFCSSTGQYTTVDATASFSGSGQDVWFVFEARNSEVKITVTGTYGDGFLRLPEIKLYNDCNGTDRLSQSYLEFNTAILNDAGLIPNRLYYISVSGAGNTGKFQLCIENYKSEIKPGQDYRSASILCSSTTTVRETFVTGSGTDESETDNTCFGREKHSAWYKWTSLNSGTLVFTITPTHFDDLDWALYELGPEDSTQSPSLENTIRCAAGHGIDIRSCPNELFYTKTGTNFTENDVFEGSGCSKKQNGMLKAVDMKRGYVYALLVNNWSSGKHGFDIEFKDIAGKAGTGLFKGPTAKLNATNANLCTSQQTFTFSADNVTGQSSIQWYFGQGASIPEASTAGPFTISYSTMGLKTVILQVKNDVGCAVVETKTFMVGIKPDLPKISGLQSRYCVGQTIVLNTPAQADAVYAWTGPDGFTSDQREIKIPVKDSNKAGAYFLSISHFGCTSDPAKVIVVSIDQSPTASFTTTSVNLCDPQQVYNFTSQSTNYQTLRWNFGDGANLSPGSASQTNSVSYSTTGTKSITLEAIGSNGCVSTFSQKIEVTIRPDLPIIESNKPNFCLTDTIRLSTPAQSDVIYKWTGPANFTSSAREPIIPVTNKAVAGTYSLIISRGDCSTGSVNINIPAIYNNPVAAFRTDPTVPIKLPFPVTVKFYNDSRDADTYLWDFGDGQTSTELNPEHIYTRRGNFDVTLAVFKSNICNASVTKGTFIITELGSLFIPNTFTPNDDYVNDEFVVKKNNIRTYRIKIFNQYGILMYSSSNLLQNWNGTYKNKQLPVGTYYYMVDAVDFDNNTVKKSGSVTILR